MIETELQVEMRRYIRLTEGWSGNHRYQIICAWMGTIRMREMNDFLSRHKTEAKDSFYKEGKEGSEEPTV